jgi:hypothetical protein
MAHVVENLACKCRALSSKPQYSIPKKTSINVLMKLFLGKPSTALQD